MTSASEEKLNQILDAALHLFGSKGFYETKMSEIAEEAGIAKGTVYLYFSSKEELFKEMSKRDFERFLSQLPEKLAQLPSFSERLEYVAYHHLQYFYNRKEYKSLFFQAPNNDPDFWEMLRGYIITYINILEDIIRKEGLNDPDLLARGFSGILDAYKMDILFDPDFKEEDMQQRAKVAVKLFLHGCQDK